MRIITAVAEQNGLDEGYVERALEKRDWQAMPLTFGRSFAGINGVQQMQTNLLAAQKHVEDISCKGVEQNIRRIDKARARTREILGGVKWREANAYHLTVNTDGWDREELPLAVKEFVLRWYGGKYADTAFRSL